MTDPHVVNLRDLDPTLREAEPAPALARQTGLLSTIAKAATVGPGGKTWTTPIRCPGRPRQRACRGRLAVTRHDVPSEIRWRCTACGKEGALVGWRKTLWDLSSRSSYAGPDDGPELELLMTQEAYDLIQREVLLSDPDLDRMVAAARWTKRGVLLSGTAVDLEELAGCVAFVANRTRNHSHERILDGVWERIDDALRGALPEDETLDEGPGPGAFAEEVLEAVRQAVAERGPASLAELQAVAGERIDTYNRQPQAEMGGLSPRQVQRLLEADWEDRDGAIGIADDLSLGELAGARLLVNARTFLEAVVGEGGIKTTTAGNLNRAFVGRMLEAMAWPEGFQEDVRRWNKVINEDDVRPLRVLRILLYEARLLRRWKGTFRVSQRGESLLSNERAGELFELLFQIHFRRLNLAYLDGLPATYEFQHTVAFSLWRFGQLADRWHEPEDLAEGLVLPVVREVLPPGEFLDPLPILVETRLLRPLANFGLAEERIGGPGGDKDAPEEEPPAEVGGTDDRDETATDEGDQGSPAPAFPSLLTIHRYRKAQLFDRFLTFRLGPP